MIFPWFVIPILSFLDISLTWALLHISQDPDCEQNNVIRYLVKRFGINLGLLITIPIIFIPICFVSYYLLNNNARIFFSGAYCMLLLYHYHFIKIAIYNEREKTPEANI